MDKYRCKDKEVKKSMRQDKRKWVDHLVMEAEEAARNGRMKDVYGLKKILSLQWFTSQCGITFAHFEPPDLLAQITN